MALSTAPAALNEGRLNTTIALGRGDATDVSRVKREVVQIYTRYHVKIYINIFPLSISIFSVVGGVKVHCSANIFPFASAAKCLMCIP